MRPSFQQTAMEQPISKLEEALEIKSLRRVISAYLNYRIAAEQDVRRWERSYEKLRHAHKELLSHLPKKYEELRRCISANFFSILNMLQAFEPPFDMTQTCEENQECVLGHREIDHHMCDKRVGPSATLIDGDPNLHIGTKETLNSGHSYAGNRAGATFISDKIEASSRINAVNSRGNEEQNGQFMAHNYVNDLNKFDKDSYTDGRSEWRPEMVDCNSSDLENNLYNNRKVTVGGIDFQDPAFQLYVPPADVDKVRCIIRNIVRDWTSEGALERDQCHKPILEELNRYFPNRSKERPPCCLVPGAGLARLACEISRLGFVCQGNEFSYYVLICSSFILNNTQAPLEWVIYPWIHSNCNMISNENQLRPVYFPDMHPGSAGITEGFSMCAGDFVEVYSHNGQAGAWDAVVTCFFIDTAHNIVDYIEIIAKTLKPGGVWINVGPLLYHFADAAEEEMSVELSLEDVKKVASHYGLKLQKEKTIETTYTANLRSMMQSRYFAAFWSMTKENDGPKHQ